MVVAFPFHDKVVKFQEERDKKHNINQNFYLKMKCLGKHVLVNSCASQSPSVQRLKNIFAISEASRALYINSDFAVDASDLYRIIMKNCCFSCTDFAPNKSNKCALLPNKHALNVICIEQ